jgi:MFS family permease
MKEVAMAEQKDGAQAINKFAGIEIPTDLTKVNFFFMFFNTMLAGILMTVPAIVQPAFLSDVIKINQDFAGSINALLQNMSQIATLFFVAYIGVLSDKVGRKILAFIGFIVLAVFYYLLTLSNGIAGFLHIPAGLSSTICALASFAPSKAAEFTEFGPGLLITYVMRLLIGIGLILCYPQFITMVGDYTYQKDRGKGMAMNGIMMGVASLVVFIVLTPIQKNVGVVITLYLIAVISLLSAVSTWGFLKDRMPETATKKTGLKEIFPVVKKSIAIKATYICALITRADIVVLATFIGTWGVKHGNEIGMAAKDATFKAMIPMMVMGVVSLLCFPVAGILLDKWGRVQTIILALISGAVGMLVFAIAPNPFSPLLYLGVIFISFGMAGAIAGANTLASDVAPKGMLGSVMGGLNTMQPIGVLFFLAVGGYLFDNLGPGWAFGLKGVASLILTVWVFMIKGDIIEELNETASVDKLPFTMEWEDEAKKMLEKVPGAFREAAVTGTEDYARNHNYEKITADVMAEFRKELGM